MQSKKRKSPFIFDKPSGKLPKYDKDNDILLDLHTKMKRQIEKIRTKFSAR
ncbi:hypothetical protein SAMN05877753_11332 [Bacillus oleivorans]|uniref:Uncharacterized protein n=1 Tax=Bacillus oleivorans TaxID=1448271 RepID=A0A285D6V4_9BACI|nr:hypothetical protein [Bacillus oleivorans]SNX75532.1 hypothetical protein SAMN05877753_11332 [Bacillus oleivorans]